MAKRHGMDEKQKGELQLETNPASSECEGHQTQSCKIVVEGENNEKSPENNHVKEENRVTSPLPLSHIPPLLFPSTSCSETVGAGETETDCKLGVKACSNHCDKKCGDIEEDSNHRTSDLAAGGKKVNELEAAEDNELNKKEYSNKNKTADTGIEFIADERDRSNIESKKSRPDIVLSKVSDPFQESKRTAVLFYVESGTFSTINEGESQITDGDETDDSVKVCGNALNCCNRSERSEGEDTLLGDSLDVNFDSGSVNTISDEDEDYLCIQYSESDLLRDTEVETTRQTCTGNGCSKSDEESPESFDELTTIDEDTNNVGDNLTNETEIKEKRSEVNEVEDVYTEPCTNEIKILKYFQTRSLVKEGTESDISAFESFYSLDNSSTATGTPVIKRIKKTLTWTPRILSEERFSSSRSTTLSSDAASFYTAETSGTFFSARSFQLDSCDNFVTCEDFQKLDFNEEPKSKLSKAKDVLVKGRDFVKSKIDCYRKRLPSLAKSNKDIKSRILCRNTCGFSCVQVGKEISLYSIPDTQANLKGGYDLEVKGGNHTSCAIHNESERQNQCNAEMSTDSGSGMTVRKVLEEKRRQADVDECQVDAEVAFDRENGKFECRQIRGTETGNITGKENERLQSNKQDGQGNMEFLSRETTEEIEDDLPIGTEATTINQQGSSKDTSEAEDSRSKKRLRWVSAIERTQGTSLTSSLTTNSSVDQLLYQREMDPELLLSNLGFGGGIQAEDTLSRIPDRFLLSQSAAPGVDQYQLVMNHPELHHLLPVMGTSQLMQGSSHTMPEASHVNTENKQDVVDSAARNQEPKKGSMHRPTFSTVAHGMKFIRGASIQSPPTPDEETKKISSIPSVLDFQNRKALARQGFYGNEFANREMKEQAESKTMKHSISAAEKRKKFHHSVKSRGNWSLTDESEESSSTGRLDTNTSMDSWDRGLVLKSFSDRFSSESSLESTDSVSEDRRKLTKQNSISNLRKQYEETIMKSMDGEYPVFCEDDNDSFDESESGRKLSLSDIRKKQVDRLMCSFDDDGDYTAQAKTPTLRELDPRSTLILAQKSTQSTLTGSPMTPKEMNFSFEQGLNDGEGEFNFTSPERAGKLSQQNKQSVSIIIEEEMNPQESTPVREVNQKQNSNELTSLTLALRSDSCNTLVPQDSNIDSETVDGDLTPRAGDALSESASSSATLSTVIHDQLDADLIDQEEMSRTLEGRSNADIMRSRSLNAKNSLKPTPYPPQESFELEEISSAENAFEDWNGNISKSVVRRGTMEKSASTHSDSSGFADLDTVGETTQFSPDISKETLLTQTKVTDLKTKSSTISHDNEFTQNAPQSLPAVQQKRNSDYQLDEIEETVEKGNSNITLMNQPRHVFVCKKIFCNDTDKEEKPVLSSISYSPDGTVQDKSLVYTLTIPVEVEKAEQSKPARYVSSLSLNVQTKSNDSAVCNSSQGSKVKQVGQVKFHKMKSKSDLDIAQCGLKDSLEDGENNVHSSGDILLNRTDVGQSFSGGSKDSPRNLTAHIPAFRVKKEVVEKKRAKEALIAANSHTADWLLSSEKHLQTDARSSTVSPFRMGRPVWASTPNLKMKRNAAQYDDSSRRIKTEGNRSFDLLLQEELGTNGEENNWTGNHFVPAHSVDELDSRQHLTEINNKLHLSDLRGDSACSSMDESVDVSRPSLIGNSCSMPEDHLNYLRLARLVNGPSHIRDTSKMPNSKFTPNFHMKNWTELPKRKHLEEETLLMQHAVQRYKTELCLMENMLFALCRTAQTELEPEDKADVEELQHLWCEVRKEVIRMEELLAQRLKAVMAGNDTYSPLDGLEIIQSMIDLLREQLYHQQMCISRDVSFTEEDLELEASRCPSAVSLTSSVSESWMSDISSQVSDIRSSLASAEQKQQQELHDRISELKKSLLSEVKGELSTTQNAKMLQLQLHARDNEIRRLKMELLLQNVNAGGTRKKHMLESDV